MASGRFITIEGTDGAGKSTQMAVVSDYLTGKNISHVITREPGGTRFGESLREVLLGQADLEIRPMAQLLLVFSSRAQHIEEVIKPALARGDWVLCDRFTDASYAYQGEAGGLGFETVAQMEQMVQGDLRPDLTLLLDVPVEIGASRSRDRGGVEDRFERLDLEVKERIRNAYLRLANENPERIRKVDASLPLHDVNRSMVEIVESFLQHCHGST